MTKMSWEKTVMSDEKILETIVGLNPYAMHRPNAVAKVQAKLTGDIAFKAGQMDRTYEVLDFIHSWERDIEEHPEWQAKLTEWGIRRDKQ